MNPQPDVDKLRSEYDRLAAQCTAASDAARPELMRRKKAANAAWVEAVRAIKRERRRHDPVVEQVQRQRREFALAAGLQPAAPEPAPSGRMSLFLCHACEPHLALGPQAVFFETIVSHPAAHAGWEN